MRQERARRRWRLDAVLERITTEVEEHNPGIVIVDSFRTVLLASQMPGLPLVVVEGELQHFVQHFVQRLALRLTNWEATNFLIGEYTEMESRISVFTVADGIFWLTNEIERSSTVRKLPRSSSSRGWSRARRRCLPFSKRIRTTSLRLDKSNWTAISRRCLPWSRCQEASGAPRCAA